MERSEAATAATRCYQEHYQPDYGHRANGIYRNRSHRLFIRAAGDSLRQLAGIGPFWFPVEVAAERAIPFGRRKVGSHRRQTQRVL